MISLIFFVLICFLFIVVAAQRSIIRERDNDLEERQRAIEYRREERGTLYREVGDLGEEIARKDKRIEDQNFDLFRRNNEITELKQRLEAIELVCDLNKPMGM